MMSNEAPVTKSPLTRRQLLARATLAGTATVASTASRPVRASAPLIVGEGKHRYECVHDFLTPPPGLLWGDTHGATQDSRGRIYVAHTVHPQSQSPDAVVVFGPDGTFITSWGARFRGGAHGIDLRNENGTEFLYHCDTKARQVVKTTLDGTVVWERGKPEEAGVYKDKMAFVPTNVAFAPNGDFFVADGYGSSFIHRYKADGTYLATWGGAGSEPGKVNTPHGLWLDTRNKNPHLVVADRENHRLQRFDLDGKHIGFDDSGIRRPCSADTKNGMLLVADLNGVVTLLDEKNKIITQLGDGYPSRLRSAPREQFIPGKFIHPHDAFFLANGDILVAEWVPIGRITLLRKI
jgi:hypothetical protein